MGWAERINRKSKVKINKDRVESNAYDNLILNPKSSFMNEVRRELAREKLRLRLKDLGHG